jgi:hypothetical protein
MIIRGLTCLADETKKHNISNLELQGGYIYVAGMISAVNAFESKLLLWKSHLYKNC